MEEVVCVCSNCFGGFRPEAITVVPRFNETMNMVVAAHICSDCLREVLDETETYLNSACHGAPYEQGYGLKYNEVIEQFVGFLLRNNLFRTAIEVRYAPSLAVGIERMQGVLDAIREGHGPLKLDEVR